MPQVTQFTEFTEFIQEATLEYNLALLDGEQAMSEQEMAEIMEEKMGRGENGKGRKREGVSWKDMPAKNLTDVTRKKAILKHFTGEDLILFADDEEDEVTELKREIELLKDAVRKLKKENDDLKTRVAQYVNDTMGEYWQARRGEL